MKNNLKYYIVSWIIFVGLFQIVCFVTPNKIGGVSKFTGTFWVGYIFNTVAFLIHFIFIWSMLQKRDQGFHTINIPLIYISICEIVIMIVVSGICMLLPGIPSWIGSIVCYSVLAFSILFFMSSKIVGDCTTDGNKRLNEKVLVFRTMTNEAVTLLNIANSKEEKLIAKKVYDTIRYSDPISSEELKDMEKCLQTKLHDLIEMFSKHKELKLINSHAEELLNLIQIRNNKCMELKRKV